VSFVAELKQRKVFRVATVYLLVAWIAVQAASIALPAFDAPAWVLRVVILLIALGFPFALVLAWALDITPDGLHFSPGGTGTKRIALVAAVLVALALFWFFRGQPALRPADIARTENPPAVPATARSIAVLPFVNMSNDPANEYFSDGIAETTLDMLAQVPNLKVVARTSSFAFKGQNKDVREIGTALGAATLLEGSVQRAGDAVRITVQLVRAADGFHLWSNHFDRRLADVFRIQDEVATEVVRALEVSLPAADEKRLTQKRTENVEAYREYLEGIALMPNRKVDDMREAARHFERAIQVDPDYAQAYVALADAYQLLHEYAGGNAGDPARIADYLDRALKLAPDLGEAYASRGSFERDTGKFAASEGDFQRAIVLAPSYASGFQWYGELLVYDLKDFVRSEQMLRRAVALDPLSPIVQDQLIQPLIAANHLDQARSELVKLQREHPDFAQGYMTQARLGMAQGDLVAALRGLREQQARDPAALNRVRAGCEIRARFGAIEQALRCLDDLAARWPDYQADWQGDRADLIIAREGPAAALAELKRSGKPDNGLLTAYLYLCLDRDDEALALLRKEFPQAFLDTPRAPFIREIPPTILAAVAQLRTGASDKGRTLLQQVVAVVRDHPSNPAMMDMAWYDVIALALQGDVDQALDGLERGVAAGVVLDITGLDTIPLLRNLRADPRYEKIIAPARARAAAQVAAAKAAGLL